MVSSITRILVLVPWIVLASVAANADTIIITDTDDGTTLGTLAVTRTDNVGPGWDEINLQIASLSVALGVGGLVDVGGTWTGVGGNLGVSPLGGTDWAPQTTNWNPTMLQSFMNFDSIEGQSYFVRGTGSAGSYASFSSGTLGSWSAVHDQPLKPLDMLATIYVTSGADVSFDGQFSFDLIEPPLGGSSDVTFSTTVPEPSSLAILITGAAICALRKRRYGISHARLFKNGGQLSCVNSKSAPSSPVAVVSNRSNHAHY